MLMRTNNRGVDEQLLKIRIALQGARDSVPDPAGLPPGKTNVGGVPVTERLGHVPRHGQPEGKLASRVENRTGSMAWDSSCGDGERMAPGTLRRPGPFDPEWITEMICGSS